MLICPAQPKLVVVLVLIVAVILVLLILSVVLLILLVIVLIVVVLIVVIVVLIVSHERLHILSLLNSTIVCVPKKKYTWYNTKKAKNRLKKQKDG